jgi:hypothetical protein
VPSTSGRGGTGNARYRRNRALMLSQDDVCRICGHGGSQTANHVIAAKYWPRGADGKPLSGMDELSNLEPAHGTMGSGRDRLHNPCPVCGRLCNQSVGARVTHRRPQTRQWL